MSPRTPSLDDVLCDRLQQSDAVVNFSGTAQHRLPIAPYVTAQDGELVLSDRAQAVLPQHVTAEGLAALLSRAVTRFLIVTDREDTAIDALLDALTESVVPHSVCRLRAQCGSGDFMDDADTDEVTERLRQLGYI